MKFLVFADIHHAPGMFEGGTWEDLAEIQACAEREGCEFIIHAGDFSHGPANVMDYVKAYNDFHIPSYHVFGNHDTDATPWEEALKCYNMPSNYYYFDNNGYRIIALDPNYYCLDGEYIHYSIRNYAKYTELRDHVPPEQLLWLEKTIDESPYPCVLISHESFERDADGVKNLQAVRDIINRANTKKANSVLLCINGHMHRDAIRILDNVCYWELNSVSYDWVDEAHDYYPKEECDAIKYLKHTLVYNDPLYAVVTLEGNMITIKGKESSMYMGINREHTNNPVFDEMGRPVVPKISSARITIG